MSLSAELQARSFIKQTTLNDLTWLDTPRVVYFGVDPSADSLHVGNLASFMPLRHMLDAGWKIVLLVGGATGMIGDPGGKSEERNLLTLEEIDRNKQAVRAQVEKLFAGQEFKLVDNYDWLSQVGLLEFLRDTGKHFSMTPLTQRDYIAQRIGQDGSGISYTEFSYTLLQGYDYWHLYKNFGVELQFGGSDQWGNMLSGVDLIRRKEGKEVHVLAGPLIINQATGKKLGKTEGGAIWLDPTKTSIYQFYQFWLNVDDKAVKDYLKYFTLLSISEIDSLIRTFEQDRASRLAQKTLAHEVTKLVHGELAAQTAQTEAEALKAPVTDQANTNESLSVSAGDSILDTLVTAGLASSKTEARQLIVSGGIYINDQKIDKDIFEAADFDHGLLKLRRGKTLQNTIIVRLK